MDGAPATRAPAPRPGLDAAQRSVAAWPSKLSPPQRAPRTVSTRTRVPCPSPLSSPSCSSRAWRRARARDPAMARCRRVPARTGPVARSGFVRGGGERSTDALRSEAVRRRRAGIAACTVSRPAAAPVFRPAVRADGGAGSEQSGCAPGALATAAPGRGPARWSHGPRGSPEQEAAQAGCVRRPRGPPQAGLSLCQGSLYASGGRGASSLRCRPGVHEVSSESGPDS